MSHMAGFCRMGNPKSSAVQALLALAHLLKGMKPGMITAAQMKGKSPPGAHR